MQRLRLDISSCPNEQASCPDSVIPRARIGEYDEAVYAYVSTHSVIHLQLEPTRMQWIIFQVS